MSTADQEFLDSLAKIIPLLTYVQKEKLLSFGEGMAFANSEKETACSGNETENK